MTKEIFAFLRLISIYYSKISCISFFKSSFLKMLDVGLLSFK